MLDGSISSPTAARQGWMALLARATRDELESAFADLTPAPAYTLLRAPEIGLAMVRGRAGGTGNAFNLGEMTMTRCAVRLDPADGRAAGTTFVGLAYLTGRDARRCELAALFDALLQTAQPPDRIRVRLLSDIGDRLDRQRHARVGEAAATRVDFFTMVREQGND